MNLDHKKHSVESSRRYIELTSEFRDRNKWPCPAEFTVPITCINRNNDQHHDPIVSGYPSYAWYQMPYSQPSGSFNSTPDDALIPRSINEVYYTSLWPVRPQVDGNNYNALNPVMPFPFGADFLDICVGTPVMANETNNACVLAQSFSGGSRKEPQLSSSLITENIWSPDPTNPTAFNPYYLPVKDYLAGSLLLKFNYDPSGPLNQRQNDTLLRRQVIVVKDLAGLANPPVLNGIITAGGVDGCIYAIYGAGTIVTGGVVALYVYTLPAAPFVTGNVVTSLILTGSEIAWVSDISSEFADRIFAFITWPEVTSATGITLPAATVESSTITSYNPTTGTVGLETEFSENFNITTDFYLIDFNSDPRDDWKSYVPGGPRVFIPGGTSRDNAYVGLYVENYGLLQNRSGNMTGPSSSLSSNVSGSVYAKITKYDAYHRVAYLENPIPLIVNQSRASIYTAPNFTFPIYSFGSSSYTIRNFPPISSHFFHRLGIANGSVAEILIMEPGERYKAGETIGSSFVSYLDNTNTIVTYPAADYLITGGGNAFRGVIREINWSNADRSRGGILRIEVLQQGQGFRVGNYHLSAVSNAQGKNAVLHIDQVYQTIELVQEGNLQNSEPIRTGEIGDYCFMPSLDQYTAPTTSSGVPPFGGLKNNNPKTAAPAIPRYYYAEFFGLGPIPPVPPPTSPQWYEGLDIQTSGYPLRIIECLEEEPFPETGLRRISGFFSKDRTFTGIFAFPMSAPATLGAEVTVIYIETEYKNFGMVYQNSYDPLVLNINPVIPSISLAAYQSNFELSTIGGNNNVLAALTQSGVIKAQSLEVLPFDHDNNHSLNYTGSTVSQNQMVCYEIELLSLILPNLPLDNNIGGLIAFYPYLYVELVNVSSPSAGNAGIIYSNNPNARKALFRVNIDDTSTPLISKFIKLDGDGSVQTIKFKPNDNLHFRVFLYNGDLFETDQQDTPPPLPVDFFVQISAEFGIRRLI